MQITSFTRNKHSAEWVISFVAEYQGHEVQAHISNSNYDGKYHLRAALDTKAQGAWGVPQLLDIWTALNKVKTQRGAQGVFNRHFSDLDQLQHIAVTTIHPAFKI
jgi:hypothetical protein